MFASRSPTEPQLWNDTGAAVFSDGYWLYGIICDHCLICIKRPELTWEGRAFFYFFIFIFIIN